MNTAAEEIPLHEQVRSFVGASRKMLIGGRWLDATSGRTFSTYNPATDEVLTRVAEDDRDDVDHAVAAAVWTRDIGKAHRIAAELRAGSIWINCYNILDAALPFGSYKQSGWGREMGHDALELYTK